MSRPTASEYAVASQLRDREAECAALRDQAQTLGRERDKLLKELFGARRLLAFSEAIQERPASPPRWIAKPPPKRYEHGIPSLAVSDIHWQEIVEPDQVNGINVYNEEVASARLRRLFERGAGLLRNLIVGADYPSVVVPMLGDMVTGWIHELPESSWEHCGDAIFSLHEHLMAGINILRDEIGKVFVPCVVGNHGRFDVRPKAKYAVQDNWDYLLYRLLAVRYEGDKQVEIAVSSALDYSYPVCGHRYIIHHGDQYKGGGGVGGPYPPILRGRYKKSERQQSIGEPFETEVMGHWHATASTFANASLINGSVIGFNEWAFINNYRPEPPKQLLWLTHPKHGITVKMDVLCREK